MRNQRGAAYILALVTLLAGSVLALAMLRSSSAYFFAETSRSEKQAAINIAEAGIEYAYWNIHYYGKKLPFSDDLTLTSGRFHVEAVDDGNRERSAMLVTSTGYYKDHAHTIKRVMLGPLPYHYALAENSNLAEPSPIVDVGSAGGIRVNGSVSIPSNANDIDSGCWATTTISAFGSVWPRYPNSPPLAFPDIDYTYYNSVAIKTYYWDTTFYSWSYPSQDGVIIVNGNASVGGYYSGVHTIVATGNIYIRSSLLPSSSNDHLALITSQQIIGDYSSTTVDAILYSHNSAKTAKIVFHSTTDMYGTLASDNIDLSGYTWLHGDQDLNIALMRKLHLPGL
ncbi:MAG: hypothetical protein ABFD54_04775 [Armatimonadota bacterium]|nr:hypothetical protein [bacterium]